MAFLEEAVRQARASAGTPSGQPNFSKNAGMGMGTVQPSRPAGSPPTPGVNTAPPGRPQNPTPNMGQPGSAPAPVPYPKPAKITQPPTANTGFTGSMGAGASSAPAATPAPQPPRPATPAPAAAPRVFQGMPRASDLRDMAPGEMAQTPWGPATIGPDGKPKIQFTPEGEQAYRKAVVVARKKFGPYVGMNDPNAPQPPIEPGQEHFNPKTGQWVKV